MIFVVPPGPPPKDGDVILRCPHIASAEKEQSEQLVSLIFATAISKAGSEIRYVALCTGCVETFTLGVLGDVEPEAAPTGGATN